MVVMEYLDGNTLFELYREPKLPSSIWSGVKKALKILLEGGYVFGDLRRNNIILVHMIERLPSIIISLPRGDYAHNDSLMAR